MSRCITVADRVKLARSERGFSQHGLSRAAGLSASVVNKLECDKHEPSTRTVRLLAHALGVSIQWLMTGGWPSPFATKQEPTRGV